MTDREKIIEIIDKWASRAVIAKINGASVYDQNNAAELADALIAANIGDMTEWKERAEEMRLCNEERKQAVKDVLLTMLDRMDRLTGCGVPYHVKKFINEIAAENGIELVKEEI